jgi:hypothetical protein
MLSRWRIVMKSLSPNQLPGGDHQQSTIAKPPKMAPATK